MAAEDERFLDTGVKCEQKETIGSYSIWIIIIREYKIKIQDSGAN